MSLQTQINKENANAVPRNLKAGAAPAKTGLTAKRGLSDLGKNSVNQLGPARSQLGQPQGSTKGATAKKTRAKKSNELTQIEQMYYLPSDRALGFSDPILEKLDQFNLTDDSVWGVPAPSLDVDLFDLESGKLGIVLENADHFEIPDYCLREVDLSDF